MTPESKSSDGEDVVDDGYITMIWTDEAGIKRTTDMLLHIKENQYLRRSLYPRPGEDSTALKHTDVHNQLADFLLKDDPVFSDVYARLKGKYGRAIKARLHKLYEVYVQKRGTLANSGAGLSDVDRFRHPEVKNLPELVRKVFPWYDIMDEFVHERAALGIDSLVNSDDQADLAVLGWGHSRGLNAARGAGVKGSDVLDAEGQGNGAGCDAHRDGVGGQGGSEKLPEKDEVDLGTENSTKNRNARVPIVDMGPIEAAIRDGDELREKGKKERLQIIMDKKEVEKQLNRDAKERRAEAEREFKLKREQFRLDFARDKLSLEIKAKEVETKLIEARIKEAEVHRGANPLGIGAEQRGGQCVTVGDDEGVGSGGALRNLKRIWE